jgi:hypothetical protein
MLGIIRGFETQTLRVATKEMKMKDIKCVHDWALVSSEENHDVFECRKCQEIRTIQWYETLPDWLKIWGQQAF